LDLGLGRHASLHTSVRYTRIEGDLNLEALLGIEPDGRTLDRYHYRELSTWHETQSDTFAAFNARTGSVAHRIVTGVEAGLSTTNTQSGVGAASSIDMYAPVYGSLPADPALSPTRYDVMRAGVYGLDQLRVGSHVIVVPAVRWSHLAIDDHVARATSHTLEGDSSASKISPSLGVVALPRQWLSLYVTAQQGFAPPAPGAYLADGRALEPSENSMVETGVKVDRFGDRLTARVGTYHIRRTNVPELEATGFYRQIGEGTSHGTELEVTGVVARGCVLRAGYAWTATDVTKDISGFAGNELPNAPHHKFNLWARYAPRDGALHRLALAGGIVHLSDSYTGANNIVIAPAYTRLDATASYAFRNRKLVLALVTENLTDRHYVTAGAGRGLFAGSGRRVALQLTSSF